MIVFVLLVSLRIWVEAFEWFWDVFVIFCVSAIIIDPCRTVTWR